MKKTVFILTTLGLFVFALATGSHMKVFGETYKVKAGSALGDAKCMVCHMTAKGGKLNPYGKDLQAALKKAETKKMTAEILKSVEGLDSNKDGVKNGDSIKKDKLPG